MKYLSKLTAFIAALLVVASCGTSSSKSEDYTRFVNPYVGTGGHGHVFLGANVPYGLVQLGPTEPTRGWDWCSGYHYSDSVLIGFGHMHLSGTGIGDLGDVAFLPVSETSQDSLTFSHADENVRPGYYSLQLKDPNVKVELTATKRAGFHRYTFAASDKAMLKLDLLQGIGWDSLTQCSMKQESEQLITGYRISQGWAKHQQVYFAAQFSQPVTQVSTSDTTVVLKINDAQKPLLVKVGISAVSVDNAKENLEKEIPAWDFDKTVADAHDAWNEALAKIAVETKDSTKLKIFYTAMYHLMTAPSVFNDVNGEYRGSDGKVYKGEFTNYTTLSLWDTYRAAMPLMTLIESDKMADMAQTFIHIYDQQGKLPIWHLMGNETDCMVGNPGIAILSDLVLKGFVEDKEAAFKALKASAMLDERGMSLLKQYGYLPFDLHAENETVAKALEYALADAGVAKVAKLLGHEEDYKYFLNRSQLYRKLFDKHSGFLRAVDSKGNFREPFNPFKSLHRQDDYTEGNAWQYAWLVPQDVHGLVSMYPSEEAFVSKLDSLFIVDGDIGADASPDISGLIGQYAHGNEPSHHIIYMYDYVGMPWKAAPMLRKTMDIMYRDSIDGLSGNEDVGQMSAWYILSSVGLYQVEPAGGKFVFGSPLFEKAALNVGKGRTFTIIAHGNDNPKNMYIQSAKLNGKEYTRSYIDYQDIMKGGKLEFFMGEKPSQFGTKAEDRP